MVNLNSVEGMMGINGVGVGVDGDCCVTCEVGERQAHRQAVSCEKSHAFCSFCYYIM